VLVTSVVWTALLSAWYPPTAGAEPDRDDGDGEKARTEATAKDVAGGAEGAAK
jgi:hypothetical protein